MDIIYWSYITKYSFFYKIIGFAKSFISTTPWVCVCVCVCVWVRVRARVDVSKGLYARVCCSRMHLSNIVFILFFFFFTDCLLAQTFGVWVWFSVCASVSVSSYSGVCSIDWLYSWQSCPRQFLRKKNYLYKSDKGCLMSLDIVL